MIREPSLKLGFVPPVVDWSDDVSSDSLSRSLNRDMTSSPALLHQVEALTTSVDARRKTRPVARLNFILIELVLSAQLKGSCVVTTKLVSR